MVAFSKRPLLEPTCTHLATLIAKRIPSHTCDDVPLSLVNAEHARFHNTNVEDIIRSTG